MTAPRSIDRETLVSFSQAAEYIKELTGGTFKPNVSTLHRWVLRGVAGRRLDARRIGRKWFTSLEAVRRFMDDSPMAAPHESNRRAVVPTPVALPQNTRDSVAELHQRIFRRSSRAG